MVQISEPGMLEKLLSLIQKLPKAERDQLRKSLEAESQLDAANPTISRLIQFSNESLQ